MICFVTLLVPLTVQLRKCTSDLFVTLEAVLTVHTVQSSTVLTGGTPFLMDDILYILFQKRESEKG